MKKLTSAALAAALSASLLVTPTVVAAEGPTTSSTDSVRKNTDNANALPPGAEAPEQPPFGSAYTGFAPLSVFLALAATVGVVTLIAQIPPIKAELERLKEQFLPSQQPQNR